MSPMSALLRRQAPLPLNITGADGHDLLTTSEADLCSKLRILPRAYLVIKETLLGEYQKRGCVLKKRQARGLVKIDVNKTSKVWDYFVSRGWLT
jgi:transcriptional adapter 2-alpha